MTTPQEVAPGAAPLLERAFDLDVVEGSWAVTDVEGEVPPYVRGTYYLNGPSRFRRGDLAYRHWLDGDGAVTRLHFGAGGVSFTHRFVRSTKWLAEEEAGGALFRTFGTAFEGDQLKRGIALESPANVSAFRWRDELLAFGEQGLPFSLDPESLETRGEYTFDGRLNAVSPLSAHPCFDAATGDMLNFGISFSKRQPSLSLYRFDAATGDLAYRKRHPLSAPCSTHDFMISGEHVIFYLSPYVLDVEGLMAGGKTIMDGLAWEPGRGTEMLVIDKATGDRLGTVPVGDRFCLHLINAFEDGDHLVVDVLELERPVYGQYQVLPDLFVDEPRALPVRRILDRKTWQVVETAEIDYTLCADFPAVDPRRDEGAYDDFWLLGISRTGEAGRKFFDQVAHLRWSSPGAHDTWNAGHNRYLGGEPVFLGDPSDPGRGSVICQELDAEARASAFLIFDAFDIAAGPRVRLRLEHPMPLGFHAAFYPEGS
ncbi:MAG: carotenoid oxygenase family protein [Acidobacteriota bacterium]